MFKYKKRLFQWLKSNTDQSVPVFICGEQRSGTNLLINTLNRSFHTECFLEEDEEAFSNYVLKEKEFIAKLIARSNAKVVAFKAISDSQNLISLLDYFPTAKGIWIFRHFNDVVNSSLRNFTEHKRYLYIMLFEPEKAGWRLQNVTQENLDLIKKFYKEGIDDASSRALIWYLRNVLFFQQKLDFNQKVILTKYENLVADPEIGFESIFQFLKINMDKKITNTVYATSVRKNTPPEIIPEIKALCENLHQQLISHTNDVTPHI
ncbi:sulfotransferase family protein [Desulfobacter postgatei]|uniref:sulfotransferase family protein n=1 Tax=Desulfobacter postgatei TaxID=2293 RepID=UPI000A00F131